VTVDATDRQILAVMQRNARTPVSEIARAVGLSSAPVSRRIERMERAGVIKGYVAVIDDQRVGGLEAFIEARLVGGEDTTELERVIRTIDEVREYYTISGDPDAIVRCKVDNVEHLQRVVNALRRSGKVVGTKTLIVMSSWARAAQALRPLEPAPTNSSD